MKASVLRGVGDVVLEERPVPTAGPGEVLVRVGSVGVCGSDVHYYEHGRIGDYTVDRPMVLGHEAGGEVAAVGPGVDSLVPGQRVSIEPGVPCRSCAQCLAGRYNLCPEMRFFATPPYDGAAGPIGQVCAQAAFAYGASEVVVTDVNPHRLQLARTPTAIALVASGRVDLDALVTGHFGLDQVEQALTAARHDPLTVKVVVHPAL